MTPPRKYEYMIMQRCLDVPDMGRALNEWQQVLNNRGHAGWQIVSVLPVSSGVIEYTLMREDRS
jgi:hypothetical protein